MADKPTTDSSRVTSFADSGARHKVPAAEDACNTRAPAHVVGAYTAETVWRNRTEFLHTAAERRLFGPRPSPEHDHTLPLP